MGCGTSFVKYVLFFFNLVVALFALVIVCISVVVLFNWNSSVVIIIISSVMFMIGSVMFIIAFFGCCGAIRESHCMVVTYAIFLLVFIIVQVVLAILIFTYGETTQDDIVKSVDEVFDQMQSPNDTERKTAETLFNNIQQEFGCCGKNGPGDYGFNTTDLPQSCCIQNVLIGNCTVALANNAGCAQKIAHVYQNLNKVITGVAIPVACIEVGGALFSLYLANSIRNMDRTYAQGNFGLSHSPHL